MNVAQYGSKLVQYNVHKLCVTTSSTNDAMTVLIVHALVLLLFKQNCLSIYQKELSR